MEEIPYYLEPKETKKEELARFRGAPAPTDYVLMSMKEEEEALAASQRFFRPSPITDARLEQKLDGESLEAAVLETITWYQDKHESLKSDCVLDYENVTWFCQSFAALKYDLDRLASHAQGLDRSKTRRLLLDIIGKTIPYRSNLIEQYWLWIDQQKEPHRPPQIDISVVPPVGQYLDLIKRRLRASQRQGRSGRQHPQREDSGSRHRDSGSRHRSGGAPRRGTRQQGGSGGSGRPSSDETSRRTTKALKEVDQAAKKLISNRGLKEVLLTPQNSFIRRLQHKKALEIDGVKSSSAGEGEDRAVVLTRARS